MLKRFPEHGDRPIAPLALLITIDTEGDNLWSRPRQITNRNSQYLARFQELCERYGLKPTWLVNYEMAMCPVFREFGRYVLDRGTGEIGMHLHAWNSPPIVPLTGDDYGHQPYLIEYPEAVMRHKIACLTDLLEKTFDYKMLSHRAGRWALDERYSRILVEHGYRVDCSVTPSLSWRSMKGNPAGPGGTDYRQAPSEPYYLDPDDVRRPGDSPLLELPMTIRPVDRRGLLLGVRRFCDAVPMRIGKQAGRHLFPVSEWFRPNGRNLTSMLRMLNDADAENRPYVQMMLHSSELMPGGSPRFPTVRSIERLYRHLDTLFAAATERFRGATLSEFAEKYGVVSSGEPSLT